MHNNNQNDLDKLVRHEQTTSILTVFVNLPEEGQYGLDIYARDPDYQAEKRTMSHCCKYLINFNKKISNNLNIQQQKSVSPTSSFKNG